MNEWWEQQDEDDRWVQQMLEDEEHQYIDEKETNQINSMIKAFDMIFGGDNVKRT